MKKEVKIGILGLIATIIIILGLKFLKGQDVFNSNPIYHIEYADINGLTISSPVYILGLQVGTVTGLEINPENLQKVIVTIEVKKEIKIPKTTVAEIMDQGFMGNKMINLNYKDKTSTDYAQSGDYLHGATKGLLASMLGKPDELGDYMIQIENGVTGVLDTVQDYFKKIDKTKGIGLALTDLQLTIANLKNLTYQVSTLLQGSNQSLQSAFANLNGITANINSKNKEIAQLLENFNAISGQLKNSELDKTISNAGATFESATLRMNELKTTLAEANVAIGNLSKIMNGVNSGKGTLGKLVSDDDLYNNLERTSKQLDLLLQDLRLNPKRYVNVSVFGKKQKDYNLPDGDPANNILDIQQDTAK